jgi:hypothetical protein
MTIRHDDGKNQDFLKFPTGYRKKYQVLSYGILSIYQMKQDLVIPVHPFFIQGNACQKVTAPVCRVPRIQNI